MLDFLLTIIRRTTFWLFWLALALVIWSELPIVRLPAFFQHVDFRLKHFIAYFTLSLLATLGFRLSGKLAVAIVFLLALAGTLEWAQSFSPDRDPDVMYMMAKALGVVVGLCLGAVFLHLVEPTPEDYPQTEQDEGGDVA